MSEPREPGSSAERQALAALRKMRQRIEELERAAAEPIAIVGLACRFPGAPDAAAFWRLLHGGVDAVDVVPADRWDIDAYYDPDPDAPGKMATRFGGFLPSVDRFDPDFFGIAPREALSIDPQHRLLLEVAWEALENAALSPAQLAASKTGVYVGISVQDYWQLQAKYCGADALNPYFGIGNALSAASGRLSYLLGLQGPSVSIDTACSSSLVAVHLACQGLRNGDCRAALVGGVNLLLLPELSVALSHAHMLSPDGRCKTFDASANGYVRGEGCGVLVLKRLSAARADGDRVLAVIRATAVNQDGRSGGFTAPNEVAQRTLIREALARAGAAPGDIDYVEAHGTGTSLGDPIEVQALAAALGDGRPAERPLIVGSVKTNLGHLESAAGVAGLIKVVLSLQHGEIPPHLHFQTVNPHIAVGDFPWRVPTESLAWSAGERRRLAGVSSFGFTGTNAHIIVGDVEQPAPEAADVTPGADRPIHVLALSAKGQEPLTALAQKFSDHLAAHPEESIADVAFSANAGRAHFGGRLAAVGASAEAIRGQLTRWSAGDAGALHSGTVEAAAPELVFLFAGQGTQRFGMGRELFETQPVFRDALKRCEALLAGELDRPLTSLLYGDPAGAALLDDTAYTQPALFALEYALVDLWRSWGVEPAAVMGHSLGEDVAACVAGVFSLEDGLAMVAERGRLMRALPDEGLMAAIIADEARVRAAVRPYGDDVSVAAVNGPDNIVISGLRRAVEAMLAAFQTEGVKARRLRSSRACHSRLMDPILDQVEQLASRMTFNAPELTFVSTVTGGVASRDELASPLHWRRHIRDGVRFQQATETLCASGHRLFVEIGPGSTAIAMGRRSVNTADAVWLPSLNGAGDTATIVDTLAALYVRGVNVDWAAFDAPFRRSKVALPTYPFQRERYWVDGADPTARAAAPTGASDSNQLLYQIRWQRLDGPGASTVKPSAHATGRKRSGVWIVMGQGDGSGDALVAELANEGIASALIPAGRAEIDRALAKLAADQQTCAGVVFMAAPDDADVTPAGACGALVETAQAMIAANLHAGLTIVTRGVHIVGSGDPPCAISQAALWGFGRAIALEHPELQPRLIDLDPSAASGDVAALATELLEPDVEDQVAWRGVDRYVPRLDHAESGAAQPMICAPDATYLITGGLGALGLRVASWLADRGARHLALVGRRGLPPRAEWAALPAGSAAARAVAAIERLEARGVEVDVVRADVSNRAALVAALGRFRESAHPLCGIVHAAGEATVRPIVELDADSIRQTLDGKATGGWLLHELTRDLDLEFFVLFSSIASLWGPVGQAHYAGANHFLDALAHHRRALGLPALSVNWGPWGGGGMASPESLAALGAMGIQPLTPEAALAALGARINAGAPQVAVAAMDWATFLPIVSAKRQRPFFDRVRPLVAVEPGETEAAETLARLHDATPADRIAILEKLVHAELQEVLGAKVVGAPRRDQGFFDVGMDSLMAVELRRRLERRFGRTLTPTLAFDFPTIARLSHHLAGQLGLIDQPAADRAKPAISPLVTDAGADAVPARPDATAEPIALIGVACRFPGGASSPDAFWQMLREGRDGIVPVPADRWDVAAYYDADPEAPAKTYTRRGGFLDAVDRFDAAFFGISPREAISMDPQQRLLLEACWEALENAALAPPSLSETPTGVFVGVTANEYAQLVAESPSNLDAYFMTGNSLNFAAGRVSFALGLQGPSLSVDTACSSSLVAVHLACQSLRSGESRVALAAGVNLMLNPQSTVVLSKARMLARDDRCKTFDAAADGYVRGEGCGVVVLKRLADAVADGDRVLAIIRGSAVNQDGPSSGLTVPNGPAQQALFRRALRQGGIAAREVDYIEAHGTGTSLGDPIEVGALGAVFGEERPADRPLRIGAVKTNIGHLESAAGMAGLIKVVLCLQHAQVPPHLNLSELNPSIALAPIPAEIPTTLVGWPAHGRARLAGVSSFGASGTNAHVLLEEPPSEQPPAAAAVDRPQHLLALSAKTPEALASLAKRYAVHLAERESAAVADVCHSANAGRAHFLHRLIVPAASTSELRASLAAFASTGDVPAGALIGSVGAQVRPKVVFLFTGQGSQYVGMGRELYDSQPVFRAALDRCAALFDSELPRPLLEVLYAPDASSATIDETRFTQPALFAIEYALAELWRSWGVVPSAVLGHSIGEYAAACVAGVFSLEDAVRLVAARGRLMQALPRNGAMAAVSASESPVRAAIAGYAATVSIAAVNAPDQIVISGAKADVAAVLARLASEGLAAQELAVSHAFHSPLMAPMLDAFAAVARAVTYHAPQIAIVSNVSGTVAAPGELARADYWVRHAREAVQFVRSMEAVRREGHSIFVEVGPTATLLALGRRSCPAADVSWLPTLRRGRSDWATLLETTASLYVRGVEIDWNGFDRGYHRRKLALPTYPFQRERFWVDRPASVRAPRVEPFDAASWVYELDWERDRSTSVEAADLAGTWLIFADAGRLGAEIAQRLAERGATTIPVRTGATFELRPDGSVQLDPADAQHFSRLHREALAATGLPLRGIVHLWSLDEEAGGGSADVGLQVASCGGVLHLAQTLLREQATSVPLWVITRGAQAVGADQTSVSPAQAPVWGLGRSLATEHPELSCHRIDLDPQGAAHDADAVWAELQRSSAGGEAALRGGLRYVPKLARHRAASERRDSTLTFGRDKTYLITGGCGALGLSVARWMLARGARHLALVGRSGAGEAASRIIAELSAAGADVRVVRGDVSRSSDVEQVLSEVHLTMPPLAGIVHAAGAIADGAVLQQHWERFAPVFGPKIAGAWNLHRQTRHLPLDFFVLFSSASSIFGNAGQANYAAANAYLDALAHLRRAEGLPALAINWGPWSGAGMAARSGEAAPPGVHPIAPDQGLAALEWLLGARSPQAVVLAVDWARFVDSLPADAEVPLLSHFVTERARRGSEAGATGKSVAETARPVLPDQLAAARAGDRLPLVRDAVQAAVAGVLRMKADAALDPQQGLRDLGLDSLMAVELRNVLQRQIARPLPATLAFDFPTVDALARRLLEILGDAGSTATIASRRADADSGALPLDEPIAIIGIGCRFPGGVSGPDAFWQRLRAGFDAVTEVPADRWDIDAFYDPDLDATGKMYTRRGAFLDRIDLFDPQFFGIAGREAISLDPQQRLLLEVGWEALESAGQAPDRLLGTSTGVFVGISSNEYAMLQMNAGTERDLYFGTGNALSTAAGRLSYVLGLQGPSLAVDTACSSSLVAVHLAARSLRSGECRMALAGGVNVMVSPEITVTLCRSRMLSPDGACRTFDAGANGYVRGEGCGIVVLKRLSDARADGDRILALVAGTAVNQDGRSSGLTAPNGPSQQALIAQAIRSAGVAPADVAYVEAHGTGTPLGDPIELQALGAALGEGRPAGEPLLVGSVKTNIGHLEAAAGIAGLIKTVLAIEHGEIPPHLHFDTPNPNVAWSELPIAVATARTSWPARPRRIAGVSSFGFSGTNAHVVIEAAPAEERTVPAHPPAHVLTLSARSRAALDALAARYVEHLSAAETPEVADICFTANAGRATFSHRLAVTGTTIADLRDRLSAHVGATGGALDRGSVGGQPPRVAFAFMGGPVDAAAVRDLADTQPAFREALERCQRAAGAVLGETPDGSSLFPMLEAAGDPSRRDLASLAVLIALAELWASWGVAPAGAIGDGIGQVAAACVAGALELEDGFRLAAGRAGAPAVDWRAPRIALASGSRLDEGRASLQASGVGAFLDITPQTARWTELLDAVATLFVAGVAIDWTAFDHGRDRRRVALPTYPFERERYWIDAPLPSAAPPVAAASAHPLIGVRLQSPAIRDIVFEAVLSRRTIPFVAGHRVHGEAIASAGVLIAMALEAARAAGHAAQTAVAGLALHEPLAIPDGSGRVVQIILSDGTPETTSFEIVARRLDEGSQPAWTVHASGVLKRPVAAPSSCVVRAQVEARCATEAPDALHDRLLLTGVENRAIPRAMTALRARPGEALAEVRLPKELRGDQDRYAVHPLVLDACFGVLAAARPDGIENDTYLLAAVDRAGLFGRLPESLWIHAAYRDGSSDRSAVIADLELTDDSERVVARIDGVRLARVGRQIARPETAEDDWFHQLVWRRQDLAADERETAPSPDAIVTAVGSELAALSHLHGLDRVGEYVERLDRLSTLYAVNALLDLGWRPAVPDVVTVERLMEVLQIATRHRRLVGSLLRMLEQDGVLAPAADRWTIRRAPDRDDAEREAASIASTFPEARIELTLVSQCGAALAGVLRGDVDPLTILFPGGSFDAVEPLYRDAPGARVFNALMQKVVAAAVAALPPGRTIRVLEVGAGTGSTTASVLPVLPPDRSRYVFTDVSASFTLRASERFSEYGFVDYQTLDLERSFEGQAIAGRQFDLVLATNVLHATRDLRQTLASLRGVLAPAGLLAFVEASRPHRWLDITFGLTEGWWRFEDADLRRHPLLTVPEWQAVLTATGFEGARALPGDAERGVATSQSLVIAQAAAAPRETDVSRAPASWLVLADQRGVGDALCEQLRARGDHVQIARHGDRLDAALAAAATASHPPLAGIVHLWPIDATPFADTTADRLDADQADGSVALLDIVHALSDRSLAARIWTATCRTQAVDCGPDSAPNPSQAPVWGLARALALEHPELWGGLLDLDMADAAESARQVLAELESTDDEDQVAWRDGRRYVARLVPASRFSGQPTVIRTDASYLITGGTGGLGLRVARWLAERGARQLVLTTRRAWRDDEASDDRERAGQREAIREIERLGARVHVATADVADLAAMRQVFALFDTALPPLAGIVHAATANHSVRLRDMTADALIAMLRAKVRGTWVLDRLTADRALDFLVLFSSTTGLLGSADLGHYAAANVFLDSFAHLRRSRGLPAVSITWGAWDQMRTGESGDRVVAQAGLQRMDSTRALALMGDLLRCDMAQPVVVSADWPTLKSVYEVRRVRPLLRELGQARRAAAAPRAPEQTALLARLAEAAVEDRAEIVTTLLRDEAARVLGLPCDQVDVRRGLFEMGMDSLMSVDLKSRLQKATGLKLPTTLTFNYPTIAALCGYLLDELSPSAAASVPAAPAPVTRAATSIDPNGSTAPTEVDDLSEDELANLLAEKLAEIQ